MEKKTRTIEEKRIMANAKSLRWYYAHHEENKKKKRESQKHKEFVKKWAENNYEKRLKISRDWKRRNKEKTKEYMDRWRVEKIEIYRWFNQIGNKKRKQAYKNGDLTFEQWAVLCERKEFKCQGCFNKFEFKNLTIDHIIPIKKGGRHTISNIQPMCLHCNCSKGIKDMNEWLDTSVKAGHMDKQTREVYTFGGKQKP